ncbi:hypothetical protein Leryth_008984 [Lithospermum erythrorhizon]|nr:hypothetical protein Leryth_008984 [Lithospermum erythrorhizon]
MVLLLRLLWLLFLVAAAAEGRNVSYDGRALIIDGERKLLFSGSIHYPRSTPDMWPSLITKGKQGGLDVIETYVFWNIHEPQPGQYDFTGRKDLVKFIKEIQSQGLYACLRIGPFIESEWNYGGLPFWLHDVPGIVFRSNNEPFKYYMQNFTTKIVNMMKAEGLYASQGGPIILSQIENEYQNVERAFGQKGTSYVLWAAKMAVGLDTGVPWVMCKQDDAPNPIINTCNGMRCGDTFVGPNSPNKPAMWTENWTSFYEVFGNDTRLRSAEDIAFHTALFIARKNGTFVNYYMYHGGTNFGRTTSSFVKTSYYDEAPLDEYGLIRQPKWGHLKDLHAAVKLCSETLLEGTQVNISFSSPLQEGYVFRRDSGECAAFLVNNDGRKNVAVQFYNASFQLPPKSISILPDCLTVAFNTAKVNSPFNTRTRKPVTKFESWEEFNEVIPGFEDTTERSQTLLEHTNTTKDQSDYLWYTTSFESDDTLDAESVLVVNSLGHSLHAFVNGEYLGYVHGTHENTTCTLKKSFYLEDGANNISILSVMVGLPDSGAHLERRVSGVNQVEIQESHRIIKLTKSNSWGYQVGLLGEELQIYDEQGYSQISQWSNFNSTPQPLTWYKTEFDAPYGSDPLALNLGSMGKGEVWVNGESIGRYWISFHTKAGYPSQTWYNVPRSFLKPRGNLLVLFEEESGNPLDITLDDVSVPNDHGSNDLNLSWLKRSATD